MYFFLLLLLFLPLSAEESLLKTRLQQAEAGDYIVIAQGKNYTLFHVNQKTPPYLTLEEITIPACKTHAVSKGWKAWIADRAPESSSWILYRINIDTGEIERYYSVTKGCFFTLSEADSFLNTLLHLNLSKIPHAQRKKVGLEPRLGQPDLRQAWQPKLFYEGEEVKGALFDAYFARWPEDGGPLSGKWIELYLPEAKSGYPSYFPYWLQVRGLLGPSKVRVIDSGRALHSPAHL